MQLVPAAIHAPILAVLAVLTSLASAQTAGAYTGYTDRACNLGGTATFPIVNTCHGLPDNSIVVTNQACGHVMVYTDAACTAGATTVALNKCTDTSSYKSLKVKC